MTFKNIFTFFSLIFLNHGFATDTINCPLKNIFAAEIYALAGQVASICSDTESEALGKIASKIIAQECQKKGMTKAVVLSNGKAIAIDKNKLVFSDMEGDFCLNSKSFKKELQARIDSLSEQNNKLKENERIKLRNLKADQAMLDKKIADHAFWESPEGKSEMGKRKKSSDLVIKMYLENAYKKPPVVQDKMLLLKNQLRKCGINSETLTPTSIDQQCKRSLKNNNYEDAVAFCSINYSSCFNDL